MKNEPSPQTGKRHKKTLLILLPVIFALLAFVIFTACYTGERMGKLPENTKEWETLPNYKNGHFLNEEPTHFNAKKAAKKTGMFRFLFVSDNAPQTFSIPQIPFEKSFFAEKPVPDGINVYWLGHSSLIFELCGIRFMTDPVFGNAAPVPFAVKRYCEPPMRRDQIPPLDFLLISHDHYDHLEYSTIRALRKSDFPIVTALGVGARLRGWGIAPERIHELNWNDSIFLNGTTITAVTARHFSGRTLSDRNETLWAAWIIERGGKKIFFGGDGGYGRHFSEIGRKHGPFDLACLEIDAWNDRWKNHHLFPHQFPLAIADLNAEYAMPIHWGVFDLAMHPWKESISLVTKEADRTGLKMITPLMGQKFTVGKDRSERWWEPLPER